VETFRDFLATFTCESTKSVFDKLLLLHMQNTMLTRGPFFKKVLGTENLHSLKTSINRLLKDLRKEVIALTDVLPFPNRGYGPLGNEDMQVYERFINNFKVAPGVTERSEFWKLSYTNSEQA